MNKKVKNELFFAYVILFIFLIGELKYVNKHHGASAYVYLWKKKEQHQ